MAGYNEHTVDEWLARLAPSLDARTFVFVCRPRLGRQHDSSPLDGVVSFASIEELEGTTYIITQDEARRAGVDASFPCRRLEPGLNTPLEGVGFLARILSELARLGIAVNPVAGYHRDTLFVPMERAEEALVALERMAAAARSRLLPSR